MIASSVRSPGGSNVTLASWPLPIVASVAGARVVVVIAEVLVVVTEVVVEVAFAVSASCWAWPEQAAAEQRMAMNKKRRTYL